jgi:predicted ATP-grasp superfamily ATP-dependent carboligase
MIGAIIIEGHVQGLSNVRSLGEAGIPVYVVDKDVCIAKYSKYCKKFFICPEFNTDDFAKFLIEMAKKENIRRWVLVPSNDHAVYTISRNKELLEKYYSIIIPGLEIIETIYDKSRLLAVGKSCGLPIPVTQYFKSVNEKLEDNLVFPVITKGRHGLSFYKAIGKKALLALNEEELRKQLMYISNKYTIEGTFTQELIPSNEYNKTVSFTAFCIDGEIKAYWMGIKLREHPLQFGTATFARSVFIQECLSLAIPLLKKLNYTGVCEVEFLLDLKTKEYKLIEINARTWLWVGLAKTCGIDYAKMIYDFMCSNEVSYPQTYDIGINWINPISDFAYSFGSILSGKLGISGYIKSLMNGKTINGLFRKNDLKPGIVYLFKIYTYLQNR